MKKEVVAMLLAGGQGSRLGELTRKKAKPAVTFAGKYKIIDFTMSNCINSGIDTIGVLTQYQPILLNKHIGIGIPWDLDKKNGGVSVLTPHIKGETGEWYTGTANAIFQNIEYIEAYNPDYILVISGDHIYKMDYDEMIKSHKSKKADVTIAAINVSYEEAKGFGTMICDDKNRISEFEEKPENPRSTLCSMGVYVFSWKRLKEALIKDRLSNYDSDFGKHIIPLIMEEGGSIYAYPFDRYWKDVGTIDAYFSANMELIQTVPEFNLYENFWNIYTDSNNQSPSFASVDSDIKTSIISEGCEIYGSIHNSVISPGVIVESGAIIRDSIIMQNCIIKKGAVIERSILDMGVVVGENAVIGEGENVPNIKKPKVYHNGISVIGEDSIIPPGVIIGKNCVVSGETLIEDYPDCNLPSGESILKGVK